MGFVSKETTGTDGGDISSSLSESESMAQEEASKGVEQDDDAGVCSDGDVRDDAGISYALRPVEISVVGSAGEETEGLVIVGLGLVGC